MKLRTEEEAEEIARCCPTISSSNEKRHGLFAVASVAVCDGLSCSISVAYYGGVLL